jgi:hypothetical protein
MSVVATTNDITAISNYAGQYQKSIILSIVNGLDVAGDVQVLYDLSADRDLPKYEANDGFRPEDTTIESPDGKQGTFSKRTIKPRVGMKIFEIIPAEFRGTYFAEQMKPNSKDIPFSEYFWTAQGRKLKAEINDNFYFGVNSEDVPAYVGANTYVAGNKVLFEKSYYEAKVSVAANETPSTNAAKWLKINNRSVAKGFGTIITQDLASIPTANKISTGALTDADAHDQFNEVYQGIPQVIKNGGGRLLCSFDAFEKYRVSTNTKYPHSKDVTDNEGNVSGYVWGSGRKWKIQPVTWMGTSQRIIGDVPHNNFSSNLVMGTNVLSDFNSIGKQIEGLHGSKMVMKMALAFQYADLSVLFINDQA